MDDFTFEMDDDLVQIETVADKEAAIGLLKQKIERLDSWTRLQMKESAFKDTAMILEMQKKDPTYRIDYLHLISQILPKDS